MRCHYLPKKYLKGFTNSTTGKLWTYTKKGEKYPCNIDKVAKINNWYPDEVERFLADEVENPANDILDKVRSLRNISKKEKQVLSEYMVVMMKRVPRGKDRVKNLMPSVTEDIRNEFDRKIEILSTQSPQKGTEINHFQNAVYKILDNYSQEFPDPIWLDNLPPDQTPQTVRALTKMTWLFLTYEQAPAILTSDNPVFYFEGIGIGKRESELSFPISSHIALWASWRSDLNGGYFPTTSQTVKELNRRTAHNAANYLYHAKEEKWISPFIKKGKWRLTPLI
jgi:hypothetical protein